MKRFWLITLLSLLLAVPSLQAEDTMKAFPEAEAGMVRYVLQLPVHDDETAFQLELIVGKTVMLDEQNRYSFGGKIESEVIEGWGFTRYRVKNIGPMMGTLMAVDPNAPKVARFIRISGEPYLVRYNSKLPVVIYVPEDAEVHYRIWSAGAEIMPMEKG